MRNSSCGFPHESRDEIEALRDNPEALAAKKNQRESITSLKGKGIEPEACASPY
jgi:hypothetical protein